MCEICVVVPGPWLDLEKVGEALARQGSFRLHDAPGGEEEHTRLLTEESTGTSCVFELDEWDPYLRHHFEGGGDLTPAELDAVLGHETAAYLMFDAGYERVRAAARFAAALLRAGGIAVRVTSAGSSHRREWWEERWTSEDPSVFHGLFVAPFIGFDEIYTCGMQSFGLPDALVPAALGWEEGARLLSVFNLHQLTTSRRPKSGDTFGESAGSPRYRLARMPEFEWEHPGSPTYNAHGRWSLEPLDAAPARR